MRKIKTSVAFSVALLEELTREAHIKGVSRSAYIGRILKNREVIDVITYTIEKGKIDRSPNIGGQLELKVIASRNKAGVMEWSIKK